MIPWFEFETFILFGVTFYSFGTLLAASIIAGIYLLNHRARATGLNPKVAEFLLYWSVGLGLYLGHVFSVFVYTPGKVFDDPMVLLRFWEGLSSIGGIAAGSLVGLAYLRIKKVSIARYFDAFFWCFVPAWTIARFGCTIVHDHPGVHTDFFLAIQYPDGPRHDLGFYEFLFSLALTIYFVATRKKQRFAGYHVIFAALTYLPARFLGDFLRIADVRYFGSGPDSGLTPAQLGIIVLFGWVLYVWKRWAASGEVITPNYGKRAGAS